MRPQDKYAPITGRNTGEVYAVIKTLGGLKLFQPADWSPPYLSIGLRYNPKAGLKLPHSPLLAVLKAKWIIGGWEAQYKRNKRYERRQVRAIRALRRFAA